MPNQQTTEEKTRFTQAELMAEGRARFGPDPLTWAFICPSCGDVATLKDFQDITGDTARAGQECIGRSLGALQKKPRANKRGCDWAAYGLFRGPWIIVLPAEDGKPEHEAASFRFASAPVPSAAVVAAAILTPDADA